MTVPVTRVVLRVLAREDTADELKAVLFALAHASREEDGCNGYKVFQSRSNSSATNPGRAMRRWKNT